jgi:hypothetical protein
MRGMSRDSLQQPISASADSMCALEALRHRHDPCAQSPSSVSAFFPSADMRTPLSSASGPPCAGQSTSSGKVKRQSGLILTKLRCPTARRASPSEVAWLSTLIMRAYRRPEFRTKRQCIASPPSRRVGRHVVSLTNGPSHLESRRCVL